MDQKKTKQPTRGWRHWTEAEAGTQLAAFRRSGMSAAAFARSNGVSTNRLEHCNPSVTDRPQARRPPLRAVAKVSHGPEREEDDGSGNSAAPRSGNSAASRKEKRA
jgi:hypothetical protein